MAEQTTTGSGGAGSDAGAGAGSGGAAGSSAGGAAGADDAKALRAELDAMRAERAAEKEAAGKATADALAKAEADRVAKLTEAQKVQEALAKQNEDIEATKAELVAERRAIALERLGVLAHFRGYAPAVDPKTPEGAAALEKWAKEHPEVIARQGSQHVETIKPLGALAEVLSGKRVSPLLKGTWAEAVIAKLNN